jgi:hypothetical protein
MAGCGSVVNVKVVWLFKNSCGKPEPSQIPAWGARRRPPDPRLTPPRRELEPWAGAGYSCFPREKRAIGHHRPGQLSAGARAPAVHRPIVQKVSSPANEDRSFLRLPTQILEARGSECRIIRASPPYPLFALHIEV